MTITALYRIFGLPVLVTGVAVFMSACELEIGDPASVVSSGGGDNNNSASTGKNNNNNTGNTGSNNNNNEPPPGTQAPGVPGLLSPGSGEVVSDSKVTFVWTDAEGAVEFELAVQGLGSGGWQSAANPLTDEFQYTYSLNPAWTQYKWAVRSIGSDGQKSAFTGWRAFSTTP